MLRRFVCVVPLLLIAGAVVADDASREASPAAKEQPVRAEKASSKDAANAQTSAQTKIATAKTDKPAAGDAQKMSGMSILGNQEAPKSLVIVPWKSSQIGDMTAFSRVLDDSTQPVDKEVFMRELAYYDIRSSK